MALLGVLILIISYIQSFFRQRGQKRYLDVFVEYGQISSLPCLEL